MILTKDGGTLPVIPGPIDSLRFVHAAILAEAEAIESAAESLTAAGVQPFRERIACFSRLVNLHTLGEEEGLFPRLAEHQSQLPTTYLHDHVEERALFGELVDLCDACVEGDEEAFTRLRRQVVVLREHAKAHVTKENELILPLVNKLFDAPTQGEMLQKILSTIGPEDMAKAVPFIVSRVDLDTAAAYVTVLSTAMPPPVFAAAKGWIAAGVDAARLEALKGRVPALA